MLTKEDIDLLLEAVEAWEKESVNSGMAVAMLGLGLSSNQDEETRKNEFSSVMDNARQEERKRARRAILLKAKLIQMQDDLAADQLFSRVVMTENQ